MKLILGLIIVLAFVGCAPFAINSMDYESPCEDLDAAWKRTSSYTYIAEKKYCQYWKSPKQFESDGGGDCEDFTGHLLYKLGEGEAIGVTYVENGERIFHYIAKYKDKYIEPQEFGEYIDLKSRGWKIYESYTWTEYMAMITDLGTRDL